MKDILVVALALLLAFTLWRLGDVERQRYALLVGMCPSEIAPANPICLKDVQVRTSPLWNIYYGLLP